jgi:ADP-ribose pyrophosphatase YjhB (NUDIX family)
MPGDGPFLWFSPQGSPWGYHRLPPGGMCVSVFLFVRRGGEVLLGRYADDPAWETLAGLDEGRRRAHGKGWTIPASHLKWGEDPREGARRVAENVLGLQGLRFTEPRVETEVGVPLRFPELGLHYDLWFFVEAGLPDAREVARPKWYEDLAFHDPAALGAADYGRSHEDVMARWLAVRR